MSGFADIYVIKKTRSKKFGIEFLNHFLPNREEGSDEYLYPQYADEAETEFQNAELLMEYLEKHPSSEYGIYWRNLDPNNFNKHGMLFYTQDHHMIFGILRHPIDFHDKSNEEECLAEMTRFLETDKGYITYECPPETTFSEFAHLVNQYKQSQSS